MKILERKNIPWEVGTLSNKMQDKTAVVDSTSQRGLVWKKPMQIDLIESIIYSIPIGALTCNKKGTVFSILDGQQKADTITKFLNNKFTLNGLNPVTLKDGTIVELDGKTFDELPKELQHIIKKRQITVYYYEDLTPAEEAFVIKKVNNGKPMTSIERAMVGAKSYPIYKELRTHKLFELALTETAMNSSVYAEIIVKAWIMLFGDNVCFDKIVFEPVMQNVEITADQKALIINVFDKIVKIHSILIQRKENKRLNRKVAKRMLKKIHLLSIVPLVKQSIDENVDEETFANWVIYFFNGDGQETTINDSYNQSSKTGTGHTTAIQIRKTAIDASWNKFKTICEKAG